MPKTLAVLLDGLLLPLTVGLSRWVARCEARLLRDGYVLSDAQRRLASALGVRHADRVRIQTLPRIPLPLPNWARTMGERVGWLSPHIAGMTLGYAIVLRDDCCGHGDYGDNGGYDPRLLAHELAHVAQFERLGGIRGFMRRYVRECIWPGYPRGELEREAQAAERRGFALDADVIPYVPSAAK